MTDFICANKDCKTPNSLPKGSRSQVCVECVKEKRRLYQVEYKKKHKGEDYTSMKVLQAARDQQEAMNNDWLRRTI